MTVWSRRLWMLSIQCIISIPCKYNADNGSESRTRRNIVVGGSFPMDVDWRISLGGHTYIDHDDDDVTWNVVDVIGRCSGGTTMERLISSNDRMSFPSVVRFVSGGWSSSSPFIIVDEWSLWQVSSSIDETFFRAVVVVVPSELIDARLNRV